jgi:DNA processing protein
MHTVRAALDAGRDVYAVPGALGAPASQGCLRLISEGAGVVVSVPTLVERLTGTQFRNRDGWLHDVLDGDGVDIVSRRWSLPVSLLLSELGRLELEGHLVRLPGHRYVKVGAWQ